MKLIPEMLCTDLAASRRFFQDVLGFKLAYERPEDQFVRLSLEGNDLMLEALVDEGRRWLTGEMTQPFGRGINLQWDVADAEAMFNRVSALAPESVYLELETMSYRCGGEVLLQTQFIVQDPDGYLFRFCTEVDAA